MKFQVQSKQNEPEAIAPAKEADDHKEYVLSTDSPSEEVVIQKIEHNLLHLCEDDIRPSNGSIHPKADEDNEQDPPLPKRPSDYDVDHADSHCQDSHNASQSLNCNGQSTF